MTANQIMPNINIITDNTFSIKELAFITAYLANGCNATRAVIDAGYSNKNPGHRICKINQPGPGRKEK